mmetsp:Transcript_91074/g.203910  ORF Transcript_91074/g.203910 Transcript_91074/m.203910 type:complete len:336 (-) Transcript_91074:106-1113(-)
MCRRSGAKDRESNCGVCFASALSGLRCCLQNWPKRDFSTKETSAWSAKTVCGDAPEEVLPPLCSCSFFAFSCFSCSASEDPSCSTKKASINGNRRLRSGFGGAAWTVDAKLAFVSAERPEEPSTRTCDGATPAERRRCAGVAMTSVSSSLSSVRSSADQSASILASWKKSSIFKSELDSLLFEASAKTSASVFTTRSNLVSMVEGSAVVASHFARAESMSVTRDASTRKSSVRTMSRCIFEAAKATRISEAIWKVSPSPLEPWPLPAWQRKSHKAKTLCWESTECISALIFAHRPMLCCSAVGLDPLLPAAPEASDAFAPPSAVAGRPSSPPGAA